MHVQTTLKTSVCAHLGVGSEGKWKHLVVVSVPEHADGVTGGGVPYSDVGVTSHLTRRHSLTVTAHRQADHNTFSICSIYM